MEWTHGHGPWHGLISGQDGPGSWVVWDGQSQGLAEWISLEFEGCKNTKTQFPQPYAEENRVFHFRPWALHVKALERKLHAWW